MEYSDAVDSVREDDEDEDCGEKECGDKPKTAGGQAVEQEN